MLRQYSCLHSQKGFALTQNYFSGQGVFHLVDDPSFILGEIDLSEIVENSVLSNAHRAFLIEKKIKEQRLRLLTKWKISDPKKIRLQMGLKDRMEQAFFLSGRYLPMMENIFKKKKLPVELTRIVFVESSFKYSIRTVADFPAPNRTICFMWQRKEKLNS